MINAISNGVALPQITTAVSSKINVRIVTRYVVNIKMKPSRGEFIYDRFQDFPGDCVRLYDFAMYHVLWGYYGSHPEEKVAAFLSKLRLTSEVLECVVIS